MHFITNDFTMNEAGAYRRHLSSRSQEWGTGLRTKGNLYPLNELLLSIHFKVFLKITGISFIYLKLYLYMLFFDAKQH